MKRRQRCNACRNPSLKRKCAVSPTKEIEEVEDKTEILTEGMRRSFKSNELSRNSGHQVLHPFSIFLFHARRLVTGLYEGYNLSPLLTMFCSLRMLINLHLVVFLLQPRPPPPPPLSGMLVHRMISPTPPPNVLQVATTT